MFERKQQIIQAHAGVRMPIDLDAETAQAP